MPWRYTSPTPRASNLGERVIDHPVLWALAGSPGQVAPPDPGSKSAATGLRLLGGCGVQSPGSAVRQRKRGAPRRLEWALLQCTPSIAHVAIRDMNGLSIDPGLDR